MTPVIWVMDNIAAGKGTGLEANPVMSSIKLLSASFNCLNQARKDVIRNELHEPVAKLCNWDTPVGQKMLFGEDMLKKIKEVEETKALDKNFRKRGYSQNSGYSSRSHPYRFQNRKEKNSPRRRRGRTITRSSKK